MLSEISEMNSFDGCVPKWWQGDNPTESTEEKQPLSHITLPIKSEPQTRHVVPTVFMRKSACNAMFRFFRRSGGIFGPAMVITQIALRSGRLCSLLQANRLRSAESSGGSSPFQQPINDVGDQVFSMIENSSRLEHGIVPGNNSSMVEKSTN